MLLKTRLGFAVFEGATYCLPACNPCFPRFCLLRARFPRFRSLFRCVLRRLFRRPRPAGKKFFQCNALFPSAVCLMSCKKRKKILAVWKMGVSLHPLSPRKWGVEKRTEGASCLKRLKQEIACVGILIYKVWGYGHGESKVKNEEILTMKSLILAQDER